MDNTYIFDLATAGSRSLIPYQPGKPIAELQRELGLEHIIKLASNENPFGPSPKALDAIQRALPELALYPDGSGYDLKSALAERLRVSGSQICLGNGSNELLELMARTFLTPECEAIYAQHGFAIYPLVTQAAGAKAVEVPARDFGHDLPAMLAAVNERTRLVFIANPNNPTGTCLGADELYAFLRELPRNVLCLLDEAYYEFAHGENYPDSLSWLPEFPNLIVTRTFSKAYGLAGLRIGYGVAGEAIADLLNRVRQPFNNNSLALAAAVAALADDAHLRRTLENNQAGMAQLTQGFAEIGLPWIPSRGNFISVALRRPALPVYEALLRLGVIVRPIGVYGMPEHLRISIGTPEENQQLLEAMRSVLQ